jgi:hypothetical protein
MIPMEAQSKIGKDNPRSLLLWIGAIAAMMGISIAIVIFTFNQWFSIVHAWWYKIILFIWPSYFMMLAFAGSVDWKVLLALGLSALINGLLYFSIAVLIYVFFHRRKA